jgi:hypothetical protein
LRARNARSSIDGLTLLIRPEPASKRTTLLWALNGDAEVTLRVVDVLGRDARVVHKEVSHRTGRYAEDLSLDGLAPGLYFVELRTTRASAVRRLIVEP